MSKSIPTVGDTVIYWPDEADVKANKEAAEVGGYLLNPPVVGQPLPAMVVASWGSNVINLRVFVDGPGPDMWKTSVLHRAEVGEPVDSSPKTMCWEWEWQAQTEGRM